MNKISKTEFWLVVIWSVTVVIMFVTEKGV